MAWIKVTHELPDKPEVWQMADRLDIDPDAVVGKLVRLWLWADSQTSDGCACGVTLAQLDRIAGVTGFGDALAFVGWAEQLKGENFVGIRLPNFERHNGKTAKTRALSALRMRRSRAESCCDSSVTKAQPDKSKRKSKNKKETPLPPLPESLNTKAMLDAWETLIAHRQEIKFPLTPRAASMMVNRFEQWGPHRAVAAINHSVANGWRGVFEPDERPGNGQPSDPRGTFATGRAWLEKQGDEPAADSVLRLNDDP